MLFKVMYCLKINLLSLLTSAAGAGDVYKHIQIQGQKAAISCRNCSIAARFHLNTMHCSFGGFYQVNGQMCLLMYTMLISTVSNVQNI